MGNDGGSIPKRDDLVKVKHTRRKATSDDSVLLLWTRCALSGQALEAPVVSCALGRLYNKDSLISYLLSPDKSPEEVAVAGHITSLKDITTLSLTKRDGRFICPVSFKDMNGSVRFVYRSPCGCVLSEPALKELREGTESTSCPVCSDDQPEHIVVLNPPREEVERIRKDLDQKAKNKKDKKKKRKADSNHNDSKRPKTIAPSVNTDVLTPELAAQLARKTETSASLSSLYASSKSRTQGDTAKGLFTGAS